MKVPVDEKILTWLLSNDTGLSSLALCACFLNLPIPLDRYGFGKYPHDPDDFGRCERFLKILTKKEKEYALKKAAGISPEWGRLVENWVALEVIDNGHILYDEMKRLIGC
jgi:hypothetical protein